MSGLSVGLIGCGRISDIHLKNCAAFDAVATRTMPMDPGNGSRWDR